MDTVFHAFAESGSLDVLSYVEHGRYYNANSEIPSLVPRWDRVETTGYQELLNLDTTLPAGHNGVNITPESCPSIGALLLQDIAFDHVLKTIDV